MVVQIQIKSVYGKPTYYPVNEAGQLFAAIAETKTLSKGDLTKIMQLGFEIQYVDAYADAQV
jgi:hypothetical protein